jgi:hypothetical protein
MTSRRRTSACAASSPLSAAISCWIASRVFFASSSVTARAIASIARADGIGLALDARLRGPRCSSRARTAGGIGPARGRPRGASASARRSSACASTTRVRSDFRQPVLRAALQVPRRADDLLLRGDQALELRAGGAAGPAGLALGQDELL